MKSRVPGGGWRPGFGRGCRAGLRGICQWAAGLCRWPASRRAARPDHGQCAGGGFAAAQQADAARHGLLRARRQLRARGDPRRHRRTQRPCPIGDAHRPSTTGAPSCRTRTGTTALCEWSRLFRSAASRFAARRSSDAAGTDAGTRPPRNLRMRPAPGLQNPSWFRLRRWSSNESAPALSISCSCPRCSRRRSSAASSAGSVRAQRSGLRSGSQAQGLPGPRAFPAC